jgi:hypothetical protein
MDPPKPFKVESGAICFGAPHNVQWGARQPVPEIAPPLPVARGTVMGHEFHFNVAALNGRWQAHSLVYYAAAMGSSGDAAMNDDVNAAPMDVADMAAHRSNDDVVAWLATHESLDENDLPYREASRIVQVANSPYEDDHGVNRNSPETWDGRVLVVNRYDWGYEDTRGYEQSSSGDNVGDDYNMNKVFWKEVFLVDYNHAVKHIEASGTDIWITTSSSSQKQESSCPPQQGQKDPPGVSMKLLNAEHIFARFGLTDDQRSVCSFLYFTGQTEMSRTVLAHDPDQRTIYVKMSPEQRHTH